MAEFKGFWEDLSQQEKDMAIMMGRTECYPSRKEAMTVEGKGTYAVKRYATRDEVPEQARELWDLIHK